MKKTIKLAAMIGEGALACVGLGALSIIVIAMLTNDDKRQKLLNSYWTDSSKVNDFDCGDLKSLYEEKKSYWNAPDIPDDDAVYLEDLEEGPCTANNSKDSGQNIVYTQNYVTPYEIRKNNVWYDIVKDENGNYIMKRAQHE